MTPIRIQVLSGLHAELAPGQLHSAAECGLGADLVVVAGDVGRAPDAPMPARRTFPYATHLALVAGNHEHYDTGVTVGGGVMNAAHHTQVWLATSDDPATAVTGGYFFHQRPHSTVHVGDAALGRTGSGGAGPRNARMAGRSPSWG